MSTFHKLPIYMNDPERSYDDENIKIDVRTLPIKYGYMKNITSVIPHNEYDNVCSANNDSDSCYVAMSAEALVSILDGYEDNSQTL